MAIDSHTTRAVTTFQSIVHGNEGFSCTVGELTAATNIDRVIAMYNDWQAGKTTERAYHDAVLSAIAQLRVESGL